MSTREASGEDAGGVSYDVWPWTLEHQFQRVTQQNTAYDRCKNPKGARSLTCHKQIDDHRAYDDAEYGVTAQGSDVSSHLFNPWRPDGVGQVIEATAAGEEVPSVWWTGAASPG